MGRIKVGISSWTEPTLVKSGWYPPTATTAEDRLRYYASKFPIVEVDSTFYAIPNERTAQLWVERTPKDFTFNAKAYALLTQHPAPATRLPKDLREKLSDSKRNLYFKDLGPKEKERVWDRFREGLQPLQDAGKLGAIVFQFPKWFLPSPASYRFMEDLREWLPDFRIAIEFRQARSEEHTSELQSHHDLVCRLLLEKKKYKTSPHGLATVAPRGHRRSVSGRGATHRHPAPRCGATRPQL